MNRFASVVVCGLAFVLASCGDPTVLHFQVSKDIPQQTIQSSVAPCQIATVVPLLESPFVMTFDQSQDFPEQDTDVAHIKSAKVHSISLAIVGGSPQPNWDFLDSLTLFAEADGQERRPIAGVTEVPDGLTALSLQPTGLQLAPYIKANGGFTLTAEATGCPPQQDADFTGHVVINISATPL